MEYMGLRETEKVAENPSSGCESGGLVVHRNPTSSPCYAADEIMNKLASTQLEGNSSTKIESSEGSFDPNPHRFFDATDFIIEMEKYSLANIKKLAHLALDHYCRRQGIELDLIDVKLCGIIEEAVINAIHISYLAVAKHDSSGTPIKFFAEVCQNSKDETKVTFCNISDPSNRARILKIVDGQSSALKRWNKCQDFVQL